MNSLWKRYICFCVLFTTFVYNKDRDNCVLHGKIYMLIRILSTFSKLMWPLWHSRKYQFNSTIQEMFQNSIFVNWSNLYSTLNLFQFSKTFCMRVFQSLGFSRWSFLELIGPVEHFNTSTAISVFKFSKAVIWTYQL